MGFIYNPGEVYDRALRDVFFLALKGSELPEVQMLEGAV